MSNAPPRQVNYIRVLALDADGARRYATGVLGVDPMRIVDVTCEGTPAFAGEYRDGARLFWVHVSGSAKGV